MLNHPDLTAHLVRLRQADLHRAAAESRLAAEARSHAGATRPRRPPTRRARQRLGMLLVAWGSRLAPVDGPAAP